MDMTQYLEIFIEETKEHLQALNQSLLQLEKNPGDKAMLDEIFRVAHTLKGMAGTMGFNKMTILTHDMENVLHALRSNEITVNTKLIDTLFKCLDALENYLNNIISSSNEGSNDYKEIIEALGMLLKDDAMLQDVHTIEPGLGSIVESGCVVHITSDISINQYEQNVINKAIDMGMNAYQITVVLNKGCLLKSARSFIIFQMLERYSDIIRSEPEVQDIEDEKFDFEFTVVVLTKESQDLFIKELNSISEVEDVIIKQLSAKTIDDPSVQAGMEQMKSSTADGDIDRSSSIDKEGKNDVDKASLVKEAAASKTKMGKTVRVDIDRLDVLINLVSELIITKTKLDGLEDIVRSQKFNDEVDTLERITTSLHDAVMKVRMVPVETVFNRFPRMIRDMSRELGKDIELNMSGEETELDRTVIDEIGEPLIHLLRNSVDHGIEPVSKREALGKPEVGRIYLRAYQSGNNVMIEVEDDGQGINVEKIKQKAIERGLVSKEAANNLSYKDITDFLFKPSFSTADKITDLSGRGVGLDVVKTKIESLNGRVEVESELGKSSKFIIKLPLTLAIYQALLVLVGEEKYAIPLSSIDQIINIKPDEVKLVQKKEVILYRNMVVPVIRLADELEVPGGKKETKQLMVVIVRNREKLAGFMVDNVIGQREIVIKTLGKLLSGIKILAGATILGDGNVALILDVNSLA